jgi:hypothetical protein
MILSGFYASLQNPTYMSFHQNHFADGGVATGG